MEYFVIDAAKGAAILNHTEFSSLGTEILQPKQKRVGLLGGTFNPVHNGHIDMAYIALYEFLLGEVVFLPLGQPPHKRDEYVAPAHHRLEMLRLATASERRFSVSTAETGRKGLTYTVDTLELLARAGRDTAYYFIIGSDTLFELGTWRNIERVMLLCDFICILRSGQDERSVRRCAAAFNQHYGHRIYLANERGQDVSSSLIREQAARNRLSGGLVPDCVANYILQNRVYV